MFSVVFRHIGYFRNDVFISKFKEELAQFVTETGSPQYPRNYHVNPDIPFTLSQQYNILSNMSNYHWGKYLTTKKQVKS